MSLHCVYLVSSRSDFLDKGYHILLVLDTHLLCYARERLLGLLEGFYGPLSTLFGRVSLLTHCIHCPLWCHSPYHVVPGGQSGGGM